MSISLNPRLSAVASFVQNGARVIDVGTDHAYLPTYLVQSKISPCAVAADINVGPLNNAKETINSAQLTDKINTVISDGLDNIEIYSGDNIIIAGMGGLMITDIISRCNYVKRNDVHLILQPMTHCEDVRKYLTCNGFDIIEEKAVRDKKHLYCIISAVYSGSIKEYAKGYIYYGELIKKSDDASAEFLNQQLMRIKKRCNAIENSEQDLSERIYLKSVIDDFEEKLHKQL